MSDNQRPGNWQNPQGGWQQQPQGQPQQQWNQQPQGQPQQQWNQQPQQQWNQQPQGQPQQQWNQQPQGQPQQQWNQQPQGQQQYQQGQQQYQQYQQQAPYGAAQQAPVKKKSKATPIIAGVLALALIVGGGFFVWNLLKGSTPAAAKGIPSNALAVIEINLNPAAADQLAVKEFVEKFPSIADEMAGADTNYKKALWELAFSDNPEAPTFDDVEPWLGDSAALGAYGSFDEPKALISVQVTDKGAAEQFAAEHLDDQVVEFLDDLMLVSMEGDPIDVDAIKNDSIADDEAYVADMAKLGGGWLLTAWGNEALFNEVLAEAGQELGVDPATMRVRGALGAKIEDGTAVTKLVTWSNEAADSLNVDGSFIESLPGDILGAIGYSANAEAYDLAWEQLQTLEEAQPGALQMFGINSAADLRALLGEQGAIVFNWSNQMPEIGLKVRTDDVDKHNEIIGNFGEMVGVQLQHHTDGDTVYTSFGINGEEFANPDSKLSDNDTFSTLVPDRDADAVLFVDLQAIFSIEELSGMLQDDSMRDVRVLTGVGMSANNVGDGYAESFIRVGTR